MKDLEQNITMANESPKTDSVRKKTIISKLQNKQEFDEESFKLNTENARKIN